MKIFKGIGASEGAALAQILFLQEYDLTVVKTENCDKGIERRKIADALSAAEKEIDLLFAKAQKQDKQSAAVFEVHKMMLSDLDFTQGIDDILEQGLNAEYAVRQTADSLKAMFASLDSEYMRERAADVEDVAARVIRILKGIAEPEDTGDKKVIVLARDLLPSQTVKLDKEKVLGFVTQQGGVTSHSVILARTMGIPCVVGMGEPFNNIPKEGMLAIDGKNGEVVYDPDEKTRAKYQSLIGAYGREKASLEDFRGKEAVTKSGHKVIVAANIGSVADAQLALDNDCGGVGLFRSEFVYLESEDFPSEEKQFEIYKAVLQKLAPRQVVIRTLDLGSDKQAPYFNISDEENPALGYRAIRICLKEQHIFTTQLRALLRASAFGSLAVMFPMITHIEQVIKIKEIVKKTKAQLDKENLPYSKDVQWGIMVETPAAALLSDKLAPLVDFFSIGTNDLTQYTLAVDRTNGKIKDLFDSSNEAVLRFIEMTADNARKNGIWVGICGESAANTSLTDFYMKLKIDELSVSPSSILKVKRAVTESE